MVKRFTGKAIGQAAFFILFATACMDQRTGTIAKQSSDSVGHLASSLTTSTTSTSSELLIFNDSMQSNFKLNSWKWGNTVASISGTKFYSGSKGIVAQHRAAWTGVSFDRLNSSGAPMPFSSSEVEAITFMFNPAGTSLKLINNLQLVLVDSGANKKSRFLPIKNYAARSFVNNSWIKIRIPIQDLTSESLKVNQIVLFSANSSTSYVTYYLDQMVMDLKISEPVAQTPPPPPTGTVTAPEGGVAFNIDTQNGVKAVSPYIYGVNETVSFRLKGTLPYPHASFYRLGGNRTTTYNWENNASNAGMDWGPNISDSYFGSSTTAGAAVASFINSAMSKNAASMVTVPLVPYVAANKNNYPLTTIASQDPSNWKINRAFKPAGASTIVADKNDGYVYQQEFVTQMESLFASERSASKALFYSLDNEPGIWSETHPLVMPNKVTYTDLLARTIEYSRMVKTYAPSALTFGAVAYGYNEYVSLQNAPDSTIYGDWFDYFLKNMKSAEVTYGKRLLDVLDIHFYTEHRTADGDPLSINGGNDAYLPQDVIDARVQAPRSLWDASFVENSWISRDYLRGAVNLLPRLKNKISTHYPGTKLAISEYSYGGEKHISGAIAQADALGIFAREGVFAANYYELREGAYPYGAFDMFRNFDGQGQRVGNQLVSATTSDHSKTSVYAYKNAGDDSTLYIVAINKTGQALPLNLGLMHTSILSSASAYQIDEFNSSPFYAGELSLQNNRLSTTLSPYSVTTFVLR